jgi:hypothetical protein
LEENAEVDVDTCSKRLMEEEDFRRRLVKRM